MDGVNPLKEDGWPGLENLERKNKEHPGEPTNRKKQITKTIILTIASSVPSPRKGLELDRT